MSKQHQEHQKTFLLNDTSMQPSGFDEEDAENILNAIKMYMQAVHSENLDTWKNYLFPDRNTVLRREQQSWMLFFEAVWVMIRESKLSNAEKSYFWFVLRDVRILDSDGSIDQHRENWDMLYSETMIRDLLQNQKRKNTLLPWVTEDEKNFKTYSCPEYHEFYDHRGEKRKECTISWKTLKQIAVENQQSIAMAEEQKRLNNHRVW
jgi:hypothetical protein